MAHRIEVRVAKLEQHDGVPDWMGRATAAALYQAAAWFGETAIEGMSFRSDGKARKLTRQTYRTLDRVLHEETDAIGSVTGTLITATPHKQAHVTVPYGCRATRCDSSMPVPESFVTAADATLPHPADSNRRSLHHR